MVARYTDLLQLQAPYDLLQTPIALSVLVVLGAVDFIADKVPVVDHVTHAIGAFVHPVAGAILFASNNNVLSNVHPVVAMVAGVIVAGGFHATRSAIRPAATATTAGTGNPVISFVEDVVSAILSVLAIFAPLIAFILFIVLLLATISAWRRVRRRLFRT